MDNRPLDHYHYHHYHLFLNREGRWGTTDDFTISFLHFSLFSTALWDLPNSRPVHSLMLSSHLFLCLPCLLPPFTVPSDHTVTIPISMSIVIGRYKLHSHNGQHEVWSAHKQQMRISLYSFRNACDNCNFEGDVNTNI